MKARDGEEQCTAKEARDSLGMWKVAEEERFHVEEFGLYGTTRSGSGN